MRSPRDGALRVRAQAKDTVLCSRSRHLTLTVPLSSQVYKWVPVNLMLRGGGGGGVMMDSHPIQENTPGRLTPQGPKKSSGLRSHLALTEI